MTKKVGCFSPARTSHNDLHRFDNASRLFRPMPWQRKTVRKSQPVDVFIVGAAKAGTTALHTALDKHPLMFMSAVKEPNYFSAAELQLEETLNKSGLITTDAEYRKLFSGAAPQQLLGEASVSYLAYPSSAERIFAYNPDAKIIISLREPVSRAIRIMRWNSDWVFASCRSKQFSTTKPGTLTFIGTTFKTGFIWNASLTSLKFSVKTRFSFFSSMIFKRIQKNYCKVCSVLLVSLE